MKEVVEFHSRNKVSNWKGAPAGRGGRSKHQQAENSGKPMSCLVGGCCRPDWDIMAVSNQMSIIIDNWHVNMGFNSAISCVDTDCTASFNSTDKF